MSLEDANKLKVGNTFDHQDNVGRFHYAEILEVQGSNLKVLYEDWGKQWSVWTDFGFKDNIKLFAFGKSISRRPAHRLKGVQRGDVIAINPQRHRGWKRAEIKRFNIMKDHSGNTVKSGQIQVVYTVNDKEWYHWVHLDDDDKVDHLENVIPI